MVDSGYALYSRCSRFHKCSVNCCPLDPMAGRRPSISGDPERTCRADVVERLGLVKQADAMGLKLCWGGLSKTETNRIGSGETTIEGLIAEDETQKAALLRKLEMAHKASHGESR